MIQIDTSTTVPQATPESIFSYLSDPEHLPQLLPRMRRVELAERSATSARLITHMELNEHLGTIRCEGDVNWNEPHEIVFTVQNPIILETRWNLTALGDDTALSASIMLDLRETLGPMALLVPSELVSNMVAADMKQALATVAEQCAGSGLREREASA